MRLSEVSAKAEPAIDVAAMVSDSAPVEQGFHGSSSLIDLSVGLGMAHYSRTTIKVITHTNVNREAG